MEIMDEIVTKSGGNNGNSIEFQKVKNVVFCVNCGKQYDSYEVNKKCSVCGSDEFLSGTFAEYLAGYLKLDNLGLLKKYFRNRFGKSAVKMNSRRIVMWLLIDDKLLGVNDGKSEDIVRRCMWHKF